MSHLDSHFLDKICTAIPSIAIPCSYFLEHLDFWIKLITFATVSLTFLYWLIRIAVIFHKRLKKGHF